MGEQNNDNILSLRQLILIGVGVMLFIFLLYGFMVGWYLAFILFEYFLRTLAYCSLSYVTLNIIIPILRKQR